MWLNVMDVFSQTTLQTPQKVSWWSNLIITKGLNIQNGPNTILRYFPILSQMYVMEDGNCLFLTAKDTAVILAPSQIKLPEHSTMAIRFQSSTLILTNYAPYYASLSGFCVPITEFRSLEEVMTYLGNFPPIPESVEECFPHSWR